MPTLRERLLAGLAGQLGRPHGLLGRIVVRRLNRGNAPAIAAAAAATQVPPGGVAADLGFGGGAGLRILLDAVGPHGTVYGVEISADMIDRARGVFGAEVGAGRLRLVSGSLTALPLPDASLDAAITVNTVYFVDDLDAVCRELARVLRPGGRAVIGIGEPDVMRRLPFAPYGFTIRPVDDIADALRRAGLTATVQPAPGGDRLPRVQLVAERPAA
ncbi:methyltransferase domain-containing protein [uncultured Mycolicibacterium sp.]|uniref:class I SAM-dependent methyltransferase n=1 Tax=uncultured Mycolicibacterium sp. TaxID=2320817 RepID=UPI00261FAD46|nr:methyltransferase domain-containing protein [uncultured Mycolicibacterium sp.]